MPYRRKRKRRKFKYATYLRSRHWITFKKRYYTIYFKQCVVCETTKYINLHHKTYERLGHERLTDVIPLCKSHHRGCHNYAKTHRRKLTLEQATDEYIAVQL